MNFASDNSSGVPQQVLDALARVNAGYALPYGNDPETQAAIAALRATFEAPDAEIVFVPTGTAANALALALMCPPWGAVFCHRLAHVEVDECGAPEFFIGGSKLKLIDGPDAQVTPEALETALDLAGRSVHQVQPAALSLTNLTECGTVYTPDQIGALARLAHDRGLAVHLDGARFANALVATGASPAAMSWQAGVDILTLGGTKNGLIAAEAVIVFDPAKAWELQLRRKRAGQLVSKCRFVSAQFNAWLHDGLWLDLAARANAAAESMERELLAVPGVTLRHPRHGNMLFAEWSQDADARARAAGASYYPMRARDGRAAARLVCSWNTPTQAIEALAAALRG